MSLDYMPDLEKRIAHLYAESLGFVASRNSAAVIVGEHNDGFPLQIRAEHPLTGSKEIIAVSQSEHILMELSQEATSS
jgi:hypothetical protein